ncbi:hypothetical protein [Streptomyces camponoticapitis]|nr:hypothetical protein [Streptomyces camponoticapitis]
MGDTGRAPYARTTPSTGADPMPRLALYALVFCLLAIAAAVVSFLRGNWLGVVWVLLAGLSSNMAWYYLRKARTAPRAS